MIRHRLWVQLIFGVILFVAVSSVVYIPARNWFHGHVATVMTFRRQAFVMNPGARVEKVQRGDIVAYEILASRTDNVIVREGTGFGRVLGLPGDRVVFEDGYLTINGLSQAQSGSSKEWGGMVVPQGCWFIWPDLDILNPHLARGELAGVIRRLALVSHSDLVARQRGWWFFRSQGSI